MQRRPPSPTRTDTLLPGTTLVRSRRMMERACGVEYLEGWVDQGPGSFPGLTARTRAFGARCVHVIAGNAPIVSILTVIRNALTRSDAIIKLPSNDPLTTVALVRTMVEMAPDHPITRHISVAYWKEIGRAHV